MKWIVLSTWGRGFGKFEKAVNNNTPDKSLHFYTVQKWTDHHGLFINNTQFVYRPAIATQ